jgi:hypothetical protein
VSRTLGTHERWLALRGATLNVPILLSTALKRPDARSEAIRVGSVVRKLYSDAVAELGENEGHDLVGATLRYVRDRVTDMFGPSAWDEVER